MILNLAQQQYPQDTMSFNSKLKTSAITQPDYHQSFHNDKSPHTIDYRNQPTPHPLSESLPFFKYSKSPESRVDDSPLTLSSTSPANNRAHKPIQPPRASSLTISHDLFRDNLAFGSHSLFQKQVHASPARSISLDSSYYNLPKISMEPTGDSPKRNHCSRSQSFSSTTPPPSLPPLSETLNNIFTDSSRESPLSCDTHVAESLPTPNSIGCSRAMSPLMATASRASDSPGEQILPPIQIHEKMPQQHGTNSHTLTPQCSNQQSESDYPTDDDKKVFSFVALPGINSKKRPRRKFDEIERLYGCNWQGCNKSYGTLNHLNAHVMMQKHGSKRLPNEFKELRKNWKKQRDDGK